VGFNIARELVFDTQTVFLSQPQKIFEEPLETNRISGSSPVVFFLCGMHHSAAISLGRSIYLLGKPISGTKKFDQSLESYFPEIRFRILCKSLINGGAKLCVGYFWDFLMKIPFFFPKEMYLNFVGVITLTT
jgi:hypothetical protein